MKLYVSIITALLLFTGLIGGMNQAYGQRPRVYVAEITREIDLELTPYINRVLSQAQDGGAAAVVLHVNTFGGRVDVATEIKDAILNSPVPVVAFVDKRAISAGALITLSASKIAMTPGGTIGAATPVYGSGAKATEKVVSFMRSEMRSTAERNHRDPAIAEAMVDENLTLADSGLKKRGQLLTMTTLEAQHAGYCDVVAPTMSEALDKLGFTNAEIVRTDLSWSESLVGILTSPVMNGILIVLGLAGVFYGVKTGHPGSISLMGLFAIAIFFGAQSLARLSGAIEILMFIAGLGLIAIEVFVIPGFGIPGIIGGLLLVASLFLSLVGNFSLMTYDSLAVPLYTLAASLVGVTILFALMLHYLPNSAMFDRFVLKSADGSAVGYLAASELSHLLGHVGEAVTTLRPAGLAHIGSGRFDVIAQGEFIRAGEPVEVIRIEGRKIVVRRLTGAEGIDASQS
jgi:membrane-bound serine protease (ClpP class)